VPSFGGRTPQSCAKIWHISLPPCRRERPVSRRLPLFLSYRVTRHAQSFGQIAGKDLTSTTKQFYNLLTYPIVQSSNVMVVCLIFCLFVLVSDIVVEKERSRYLEAHNQRTFLVLGQFQATPFIPRATSASYDIQSAMPVTCFQTEPIRRFSVIFHQLS